MAEGTAEIKGGWLHLPVPSRRVALVIGVVVTFLWATSIIIIRYGVTDAGIDPIGFAGARFMIGGLILLPLAIPAMRRVRSWQGSRPWFARVVIYGLMVFGLAQIGFYLAAGELPASTVGLFMAISPVVTAIVALPSTTERATPLQIVGVVVLAIGVAAYFGFEPVDADPVTGLGAALLIPVLVGGGALLGRRVAVDSLHFGGPLTMTAVAMVIGAGFTLTVGLIVEGLPSFDATAWGLILWTAAINSALTYALWAQTQRRLKAIEASVLADLTIIIIAVLGWVILGETLGPAEVIGIGLVLAGVIAVQVAPYVRD